MAELLRSGRFLITKSFRFEAAHRLSGLRAGHKCAQMHGHSYRVEVILTSGELTQPGFVTDFGDLAPFARFLAEELDHQVLNEVVPCEPTSELLAQYLAAWFIKNLEPGIPGRLMAVRVSETPSSWASFELGEGTDATAILTRMRNLADAALSRGWNLTPRLHTLIRK